MPHPRAAPATQRAVRGQHHPSRFSAAATTDQGRVRSPDRPHPDADRCGSRRHGPCAERGTGNWRTTPRPGAGLTVSDSRGKAGHPGPAGRDRESQPGTSPRLAAIRPVARAGLAGLVAVSGMSAAAGSAAAGLHRDHRAAAGCPVPCPRCHVRCLRSGSRIGSRRGAGGQVSGRAPGQWWPLLKTGKDGAARVRLAGWPGLPAGAASPGFPAVVLIQAGRSYRTTARIP